MMKKIITAMLFMVLVMCVVPVTANAKGDDGAWEQEYNDSWDDADVLEPLELMHGTMSYNDTDVYTFYVNGYAEVEFINVFSSESFGLAIYDSYGELVEEVSGSDAGYFEVTLWEDIFYLEVKDYGTDYGYEYELFLWIGYQEIEDNNSMDLADVIYHDTYWCGEMFGRDLDYYEFSLHAETRIYVMCESMYSTLKVKLYDSEGNLIAAGVESVSEGVVSDNLEHTLAAGTYYIVISHDNVSYPSNEYCFYFYDSEGAADGKHEYKMTYEQEMSCTQDGYRMMECICGDYYYDGYVEASHSYDNNYDLECNVCGESRAFLNGWKLESAGWAFYIENERVTSRWMRDSKGWVYLDEYGYMLTDCWVEDSEGLCWVGTDGYCVTNQWIQDDWGWSFLDANGHMLVNCWKSDSKGWCYLGDDGYMVTETWVKDSKGWCYIGSEGYCVTNKWIQDDIGWRYLDASGRVATNRWLQDSSGWCYAGTDGYCVANTWKKDSKGWCYLDENGRMAINRWIKDSVGWCYLGSNGYCITNKWVADSKGWCYLDGNGRMATNRWIADSKGWCYVGADGYMVKDDWQRDRTGWHYINSSGYMAKHNLDWHNHSFAAATLYTREKCSCGAERGKALAIDMNKKVGSPNDCDRIDSLGGFSFYKNSADGIKVLWGGENISGKTINYYTLTFYFYNAVGDSAYSDITGEASKTVRIVGPILPNDNLLYYDIVDYVPTCSKVTLGEIKLEYADGSVDYGWYGWSTTTKNSLLR